MQSQQENLEEMKEIMMGNFSSDESGHSIEVPKDWQNRINNSTQRKIKVP